MRSADGPGVECEVYVEAEPGRVWELVTDIELSTRFSPELQRVRWLDGAAGPALGACFEGVNRNPVLGEWRTVSHVTEFDSPRRFAWLVVDADNRYGGGDPDPGNPMATWWFALEPAGGGTLLRHGVRIGPARSGIDLAVDRMPDRADAIVQHRLGALRNAIQELLQGVRTLAEQPR